MIELDQKAIEVARERVGSMSDGLEDAQRKNGRNSVYKSIGDAIDGELVNPVLRRAKELGEPHVGDRVSNIEPVRGEWIGDQYSAGLDSDDVVVLSHEGGSGSYTTRGPYKIEANGDKPLSFSVDGRPIVVNYVIHPGVRGKRFMQQAIREREDEITEEALDASQETLEDALDPGR